MGILMCCCRPIASNAMTPDVETRRRQQIEAAERRQKEAAARGIKDPEKVKRLQQQAEEMEKREMELRNDGGPALRWTAN